MAFLLSLSIAVLAAGPLLFKLASQSRAAAAMLDGFVRFAVAGLLLVHVLPWAWGIGAWMAVAFFAIGLITPVLLHKKLHSGSLPTEFGLAAAALGIHAFIDGAAIFEHQTASSSTQMLAVAVILHRLPVGIGLWWLVQPRFGKKTAWLVLALLAIATILGSFFSQSVLAGSSVQIVAAVQAVFAGALLHVVLGHHFPIFENLGPKPSCSKSQARVNRFSALGAISGITLLFALSWFEPESSQHGHLDGFASTFLTLAAKSAPALLAASLTIMLTKAFVPGSMVKFFQGKTNFGSALRGTVAGLPVPICSCGVVPVYRGLIAAGTPPPAALSFLVAAPEVGWAAIMLSFGLLGFDLTIARLAGAAFLAMVVGVIVGRLIPAAPRQQEEAETKLSFAERLRAGANYGFGNIIEDTAPWIIAGLLLAAAIEPAIGSSWLADLPIGVDVLAATLIGLPLYVCASGSTPLVAILLLKGLSPGAAVAFLLTGPATNLTTAGLLSNLHGKKVAVAFATTMISMAIITGLLVNLFLANSSEVSGGGAIHNHFSQLEIYSTIALAILYLRALLNMGAPNFISKVIHPHDTGEVSDNCCAEEPAKPKSCCSSTNIEK